MIMLSELQTSHPPGKCSIQLVKTLLKKNFIAPIANSHKNFILHMAHATESSHRILLAM